MIKKLKSSAAVFYTKISQTIPIVTHEKPV